MIRGQANQLGVAEECSRAMVVAVQECQWLLLQHQEDRVNQLEIFGEVVEVVQDDQWRRPSTVRVADCIEDAIVVYRRH